MATNPRTWRVGTSTSLFGLIDHEQLRACKEAGIESIELILFGGGLDPTSADGLAVLRDRAAEAARLGLELWSVHLPFGRKWDHSDAAQCEWALAAQTRLIEFGAELGAKAAVIHPSAEPIAPEDRPDRMARSKDVLGRLSQVAAGAGIRLAAECLPRTCLGNTADEVLHLLEGNDELGVCFDSNHLLQETPEAFVAKVGRHIVTIHISDYDAVDERHWLPGRGVIDWSAVIGQLAAAGYDGRFMFEVGQKNAEKPIGATDLVRCWQGLRDRYQAASA